MKRKILKNGLHLLNEGEDLAAYGISIMGDDLDGEETVKCEKTIDLFTTLAGPMGRVTE